MAVANSIARAHGAIDGSADVYINTSVDGIGKRAGQADLLSCIMGLKFARDLLQTYELFDHEYLGEDEPLRPEGGRIIST